RPARRLRGARPERAHRASTGAPLCHAPRPAAWAHSGPGRARGRYLPPRPAPAAPPKARAAAPPHSAPTDARAHRPAPTIGGCARRCGGLDVVELECIARGHLTGSGLADDRAGGSVGGHVLPSGLVEASRLEPAIFTPSTKAGPGEHDENIAVAQARELLGEELTEQLETLTLAVFERARRIADERGIILADTKLEFGRSRVDGTLTLGDEVLTPDSSRFWSADTYAPGRTPPSLDKQFVRDWLTSPASGWSKGSTTAPPELPAEVVAQTRRRYVEAYERLTGQAFCAGCSARAGPSHQDQHCRDRDRDPEGEESVGRFQRHGTPERATSRPEPPPPAGAGDPVRPAHRVAP